MFNSLRIRLVNMNNSEQILRQQQQQQQQNKINSSIMYLDSYVYILLIYLTCHFERMSVDERVMDLRKQDLL